MERNYVWEKDEFIDLNSGEPHFDDERTLLAAQPVVPLEVVTQAKKHRRWVLIGAFVIASILGSVVALALVRLQEARVSDAASATTTETNNEPVAQAPEGQSETQLFDETFAEEVETVPTRPSGQRPRSVANRRSTTPPVRIVVRPNDNDAENPQPRLVDQWQEQRLRRVIRQPQNHHQSDLFRIREIFEGPRHPREPLN